MNLFSRDGVSPLSHDGPKKTKRRLTINRLRVFMNQWCLAKEIILKVAAVVVRNAPVIPTKKRE